MHKFSPHKRALSFQKSCFWDFLQMQDQSLPEKQQLSFPLSYQVGCTGKLSSVGDQKGNFHTPLGQGLIHYAFLEGVLAFSLTCPFGNWSKNLDKLFWNAASIPAHYFTIIKTSKVNIGCNLPFDFSKTSFDWSSIRYAVVYIYLLIFFIILD